MQYFFDVLFFRSIRPLVFTITGSLVGVGITIGMLLTLLAAVVATRVARNRRRPIQRPPHPSPNEAGDVELQELNVIAPVIESNQVKSYNLTRI